MEPEQYQTLVEQLKPKNNVIQNTMRAFLIGGLICLSAEIIYVLLIRNGISVELSKSLITLLYVFLGVFLTGLGIYEKLGKYAGAGSIVPISGFANSVASPAIEHKKEGLISGVGTQIFTVCGPVILYGTMASIICGIIYYLIKLNG